MRAFVLADLCRGTFNGCLEGRGTLSVSNLLQGNILFDIVLVQPDKLTIALIEQLYQPAQAEIAYDLLTKAQQRGLSALVINPSYGAEGVVLFRVAEIVPDHVLPHATVGIST